MIGRREFITLVGGAVAGWPFEAHAEQAPRKRPLLGYLITGTKDGLTHSVSAFLTRLRDLGYVEGQNIDIHRRKLLTSSTRKLTRASPTPSSRHSLPAWAARFFPARPPTLANSSPTKRRNGATSSVPSTSRRGNATGNRDAGKFAADATQLPTGCQPESLAKPTRRRSHKATRGSWFHVLRARRPYFFCRAGRRAPPA